MSDTNFRDDDGPLPSYPLSQRVVDGYETSWWQDVNDFVYRFGADPKHYGAKADGVTDDSAAIQRCFNSNLWVNFGGPDRNYLVSSPVIPQSMTRMMGNGARLIQGTLNVEIVNFANKTDIQVYGLRFLGLGVDFTNTDACRGIAMYGGVNSRIDIHHCEFENFGYTSVRFAGAGSVLRFCDNYVKGPGLAVLTPVVSGANYGVLFDAGTTKVQAHRNQIHDTAQGIRASGVGDSHSYNDNVIWDIVGQHGMYLGAAITSLAAVGNVVYKPRLIGIKFQDDDSYGSGSRNVNIDGNTIFQPGGDGLQMVNATPGAVFLNDGSSISNNVVYEPGQDGIVLNYCIRGSFKNNIVVSPVREGLSYSAMDQCDIEGNEIFGAGNNGIRELITSNRMRVRHNKIVDPAQTNTPGERFGYQAVSYGVDYEVSHNLIVDSTGNMEYGTILFGAQSSLTYDYNTVRNATTTGARFNNPQAVIRSYRGNRFEGGLGPTTTGPIVPTVASAANLVLPTGWKTIFISGVAAINTIAAGGFEGEIVTLVFTGVGCTVVDGANLNLAGNFVSTGGGFDCLTLNCDGINFNEMSRSNN